MFLFVKELSLVLTLVFINLLGEVELYLLHIVDDLCHFELILKDDERSDWMH